MRADREVKKKLEAKFTALCHAVREKNNEDIQAALANGAPLKISDSIETPIGIALSTKNFAAIQLFIDHAQAEKDIQFMLEKMIDFELMRDFADHINKLDESKQTAVKNKLTRALGLALFNAVDTDNLALLRVLLALGADRTVTKLKRTEAYKEIHPYTKTIQLTYTEKQIRPIEVAYEEQAWEMISAFADYPVLNDVLDRTGYYEILCLLARSQDKQQIELAKLFVERGVICGMKTDSKYISAGSAAASSRAYDLLELMLERYPEILEDHRMIRVSNTRALALYLKLSNGFVSILNALIVKECWSREVPTEMSEFLKRYKEEKKINVNEEVFKAILEKTVADASFYSADVIVDYSVSIITLLVELGISLIPADGKEPPIQILMKKLFDPKCPASIPRKTSFSKLFGAHSTDEADRSGYSGAIHFLATKNEFGMIMDLLPALTSAATPNKTIEIDLKETIKIAVAQKQIDLTVLKKLLEMYKHFDPEFADGVTLIQSVLNPPDLSVLHCFIEKGCSAPIIIEQISLPVALALIEDLLKSSTADREALFNALNKKSDSKLLLQQAITTKSFHLASMLLEHADHSLVHPVEDIIEFQKQRANPSLFDVLRFFNTNVWFQDVKTKPLTELFTELNCFCSRIFARSDNLLLESERYALSAIISNYEQKADQPISLGDLLIISLIKNNAEYAKGNTNHYRNTYYRFVMRCERDDNPTNFGSSSLFNRRSVSVFEKAIAEIEVQLAGRVKDDPDPATFAMLSLKYVLMSDCSNPNVDREKFKQMLERWDGAPSKIFGQTNAFVIATASAAFEKTQAESRESRSYADQLWAALGNQPVSDAVFIKGITDKLFGSVSQPAQASASA